MKRWLSIVVLMLVALSIATEGQIRLRIKVASSGGAEWVVDASPVTLPQVFVTLDATNTTPDYTIPEGCTEIAFNTTPLGDCKELLVNSGEALQTALTAARRGDRVALDCGATFQAPAGGFVLDSKSGSGRVYITPQDDCLDDLPAKGNRIIPDDLVGSPCDESDALYCVSYGADGIHGGGDDVTATPNFDVSAFPTLTGESGYPYLVMKTSTGADGYVLVGFTMKAPSTTWSPGHFRTYTSDSTDSGTGDIILDRMYMPALVNGGSSAVAFLGCDLCAVSNSYINNWYRGDGDSSGVLVCNWSNGIGVYNNYISATGENIYAADLCVTGLGDPAALNSVAGDIDIRWNLLQKELDWIASIGSGNNNYKNLIESKAGQRVLVEGNILRNSYASNGAVQAGQETSFNLKEGDEDTYKYTANYTVRKNYWQTGIGNAIKFCFSECNGTNAYNGASFAFINNLIHVDGVAFGRGVDTDGYCFYQIVTAGGPFIIDHNTCLTKTGNMFGNVGNLEGTTWDCVITNNIGLDGTNPTTEAEIDSVCPGTYTVTNGVYVGGIAGNHPAGQVGFPAAWANVGFENYNSGNAGGDFRLASGSAYRAVCSDPYSTGTTDCGANVPVVLNAVSCVLTGQCAAWTSGG